MDEAMELGLAEAAEPRHVAELLKLETYQGMTDEEIESLLAFKIERALLDDERQKIIDARLEEGKLQMQVLAEAQLMAQQAMERRLHLPRELRTVADDDA